MFHPHTASQLQKEKQNQEEKKLHADIELVAMTKSNSSQEKSAASSRFLGVPKKPVPQSATDVKVSVLSALNRR